MTDFFKKNGFFQNSVRKVRKPSPIADGFLENSVEKNPSDRILQKISQNSVDRFFMTDFSYSYTLSYISHIY